MSFAISYSRKIYSEALVAIASTNGHNDVSTIKCHGPAASEPNDLIPIGYYEVGLDEGCTGNLLGLLRKEEGGVRE